jgi:hypothetical protein
MRTLVIESATEACSVALFDGGELLAGAFEVIGRGQQVMRAGDQQRVGHLPPVPSLAVCWIERGVHDRHDPVDIVGHAGSRASGARP